MGENIKSVELNEQELDKAAGGFEFSSTEGVIAEEQQTHDGTQGCGNYGGRTARVYR